MVGSVLIGVNGSIGETDLKREDLNKSVIGNSSVDDVGVAVSVGRLGS